MIQVIILYHCLKTEHIDDILHCPYPFRNTLLDKQLTMVEIGVINIIIILIDLLVRDKMSISNQLITDILLHKRIKSRSTVKRKRRYHLKLS